MLFRSIISSFNEFRRELQFLKTKNFAAYSNNVKGNQSNQQETHVIIIGESTSSHHMSLYGYSKKTNPELEKIKNRLLIFSQAKTAAVHTAEAINSALMFKESGGSSTGYSLIDELNDAGYETFWISNQELIGNRQSYVTAIAKRAKHIQFINGGSGYTYDENILPLLRETLQHPSGKKVIILHLAGTHLSYQNKIGRAHV